MVEAVGRSGTGAMSRARVFAVAVSGPDPPAGQDAEA